MNWYELYKLAADYKGNRCPEVYFRPDFKCPEFHSQLSKGMKGALFENDTWITWEVDESGKPHHDMILDCCFDGASATIIATHWFNGAMHVFSKSFRTFDDKMQSVIRSFRGNRGTGSKIFIEALDGEWGDDFRAYELEAKRRA